MSFLDEKSVSNFKIDANRARQIVKEVQDINGSYLRKETDDVLDKIAVAAYRGESILNLDYLDPIVIKRLRALGFEVNVSSARNETYTNIMWSE